MFIIKGIKRKLKRALNWDIDDFIKSVENNTCTQEKANNFLIGNIKRFKENQQYLERFSKALEKNSNLTELYLSHYDLYYKEFNEQARILSDGLKLNKGVRSIYFYNSAIDDKAFAYICEALKVNRTIEKIDLSKNNLTEQAAILLVDVLKYNTTLTDIRLSENAIGEGAVAIAEALAFNCSLTRLELDRTKITSNGMVAIGKALKVNTNLKSLNLCYNPNRGYIGLCYDPEHRSNFIPLFEAIKASNTLTELDIGHNHLNDQTMSALNECLRQNKSLIKLSYSYQFHMGRNFIIFLNSLRENQSIRFLDLRSNHINVENLIAVADYLDNHPNVISMKFYDCSADLYAASNELEKTRTNAITKLVGAISEHRNLKDFKISTAHFGDVEDIRALAHYYTNRNNVRATTILSFNKRFDNKYKFMDKGIMKLIFDFAELRVKFPNNTTLKALTNEKNPGSQKNPEQIPQSPILKTPLALQFQSNLARMNNQIQEIQSALNHSPTPGL